MNSHDHNSKTKIFGVPVKDGRTGSPSGPDPSPIAQLLTRILGTGLFTGYFPVAQGTAGSALFVILWWLFVPASRFLQLLLIVFIHVISVPLSNWGERMWGPDPGRITIDEWAGQAVALYGVPKQFLPVLKAFLLFRLFDSLKLPFIKRHIETLPGGWGVTLDDTAAGILAKCIMPFLRLKKRH